MSLFEKEVVRLLYEEPFFAALSMRINKRAIKGGHIAGVGIVNGRLEMVYNEEMFFSLDAETRLGLLKHEMYHIVLAHLTERLLYSDESKEMQEIYAVVANIAKDLAINTHIPSLSGVKKVLVKGEMQEIYFCIPGGKGYEKYPPNLTSEAYYDMLKKDEEFLATFKCSVCKKKIPFNEKDELKDDYCKGCKGYGGVLGESGPEHGNHDKHEGFGESKVNDAILKDVLNKAYKDGLRKGFGSLSHEYQELLKNYFSNYVDWKMLFRRFVKFSIRNGKKSSLMKLNKRYPYMFAGKKYNRTANIAVSIDESGSVSNEMLEVFIAELNSLSRMVEFTVIPFDTKINKKNIFVWKKGSKLDFIRRQAGGTDFDAPTNWVNENKSPNGSKFDGHIILTDLEAPQPGPSRCKRMWITTESCSNSYFDPKSIGEVVTYIPDEQLR